MLHEVVGVVRRCESRNLNSKEKENLRELRDDDKRGDGENGVGQSGSGVSELQDGMMEVQGRSGGLVA